MRHQALQGRNEEAPGCKNIEAAFIERLGLAVWIERGPESSVPTEQQMTNGTHSQLVIVLADFVVGDPKEMGNGR